MGVFVAYFYNKAYLRLLVMILTHKTYYSGTIYYIFKNTRLKWQLTTITTRKLYLADPQHFTHSVNHANKMRRIATYAMKVMPGVVNIRLEFNFHVFRVVSKTVENICKRKKKTPSSFENHQVVYYYFLVIVDDRLTKEMMTSSSRIIIIRKPSVFFIICTTNNQFDTRVELWSTNKVIKIILYFCIVYDTYVTRDINVKNVFTLFFVSQVIHVAFRKWKGRRHLIDPNLKYATL